MPQKDGVQPILRNPTTEKDRSATPLDKTLAYASGKPTLFLRANTPVALGGRMASTDSFQNPVRNRGVRNALPMCTCAPRAEGTCQGKSFHHAKASGKRIPGRHAMNAGIFANGPFFVLFLFARLCSRNWPLTVGIILKYRL